MAFRRRRRFRPSVVWVPGNLQGWSGYGNANPGTDERAGPIQIGGAQEYFSTGHISQVDLLLGETSGTPQNRIDVGTGNLVIDRIVGDVAWFDIGAVGDPGTTWFPNGVDIIQWICVLPETPGAVVGVAAGTLDFSTWGRVNFADVQSTMGGIIWARRWSQYNPIQNFNEGLGGDSFSGCVGAAPFGTRVDVRPKRKLRNDERLVLNMCVGQWTTQGGHFQNNLYQNYAFVPRLRVLVHKQTGKRR